MLENIPQPLYKYRIWENEYNKRILTENEIFLASPDKFNDPFDSALPFRYKKSDMTEENIFLKLMEVIKRMNPLLPDTEIHNMCFQRQQSGEFNSGRYWREFYPYFKNEINKRFGILSLTSKPDNITMWSHYADSHKGFCVGLDKNILFDICNGTLGPVDYPEDEEYPEIPLFDTSESALTILTMTKSNHWKYEDEYRIVKIDCANKVIKIPNECVLEIILGCKMEESYKKEIHSLAKEKFPQANIFEALTNDEKFKLDLIPILKSS